MPCKCSASVLGISNDWLPVAAISLNFLGVCIQIVRQIHLGFKMSENPRKIHKMQKAKLNIRA